MSERIKVHLSPLPHFCKYDSSNYILCGIDFHINDRGNIHSFSSQTSDQCIKQLLAEIDLSLSGKLSPDVELYYPIPWILGDHCVYPYSFKVHSPSTWSFRYKPNPIDEEFNFECDLSKSDLISFQKQLEEQFLKIDWGEMGKIPIYTFKLPEKTFQWYYSARTLCETLEDLCFGQTIKAMYVGAENYANPLRVEENYVNYYLGSELIIQLEDVLLDLLIFANGLVKLRVFDSSEYSLTGPTMRFIQDGRYDYCNIGNVYNAFQAEYCSQTIRRVFVEDTEWHPWTPKDFRKEKLGDPIELPRIITFHLSNDWALSIYGLDDDFAIKIFPL